MRFSDLYDFLLAELCNFEVIYAFFKIIESNAGTLLWEKIRIKHSCYYADCILIKIYRKKTGYFLILLKILFLVGVNPHGRRGFFSIP